ncbi:MAG: putative metalloprotease CJM1_0395 family protein [Alphaproteobacteria bacterium]|nr:putative metalloprotease CJM1_0395 family protein [Alphaproteobacteria bacterium]
MKIPSVTAAIVATQSLAVTQVAARTSAVQTTLQSPRETLRATGFTSGQTALSQESVNLLQASGGARDPINADATTVPSTFANDPTALGNATAPQPLFAPPPPSVPNQPGNDAAPQKDAERSDSQDEEGSDGLTPEEEEEVADLKERDAEVRRHEQAHAAVGGQYAGAPQFKYETGPDGAQYAVEGEVRISSSAIPGDPEATIEKAMQVRRAALAPAVPSAQDQQVAAQAQQQINQARAELASQNTEDSTASDSNSPNTPSDPNALQNQIAPNDDRASRNLLATQAFQQSQQLGAA